MALEMVPSALQRLIPWRKDDVLENFQKASYQMMRDFYSDFNQLLSPVVSDLRLDFIPYMDLTETDDSIQVAVELPGLTEKDVDINVSADYLTIKGHKSEDASHKTANRYVTERRFGQFERTFRLPAEVDRDKIAASFDKGVLKINIPKTAEAKQSFRKIPIKH